MRKMFFVILATALTVAMVSIQPAKASPNLNWSTCGSCPESSEVYVSGNTISLGIANRTEYSLQNNSKHGASALLPPASKYIITFDYDLYTWDSYNPIAQGWTGYWDSFSVSVSSSPYWQLSLFDPVTNGNLPGLGFIWGGVLYADGTLEKAKGTKTITVHGNPSGDNYLNVVLDTATFPHSNHLFPSWGTITIKDIQVNTIQIDGNQAANLARSVVGANYLWAGDGWDTQSSVFVSSQQVFDGYYFQKNVFDKGLDCSGLVLWSHNKAVGANTKFGGPVKNRTADAIYKLNTEDVSKSDLAPGDLLFFDNLPKDGNMDHVAMYVGGRNPAENVVEAATIPKPVVMYSSLDSRMNAKEFAGLRRLSTAQKGLTVNAYSPVTLIVTDPDGYTIDVNTLISTEEEQLREIPGVLYYQSDNDDDIVYAPILKQGVYIIKVIPKPDASSSDTYSLEVDGASKLIILAQDVPIADIPPQGYAILSTGDEIVPINQPPILTVPKDLIVRYGNSLTFEISAIDPENPGNTLVFSATGLPNNLILTNNGNGTATISGIVDVAPGTYTAEITVTDPGGLSDTKSVTIEVAYSVPTLPVLDNFNRLDGAIGTNWLGNKSKYRIYNNQLRLTYIGTVTDIFWKTPFGADQEAYVTFAKISTTTKEQSLLLKAQSNRTWGNGVLEVQYNPQEKTVQVFTWEWPKGWVKYGDDISVTFVDGDVFGSRARPDGIVEIYRNGELIGTRDISTWPYYSKGGYIGLWVLNTKNTILDDFGGGTVPAFP